MVEQVATEQLVLEQVIAARLADPDDVVLARDILGTTDPPVIAAQVRAFVPGITGCPLFTLSVGAVFVLDRGDERIVLKIHRFGAGLRDFHTFDELTAVYAAQAALAGAGIACARVLEAPRRFAPGRAAAVMSFVDPGAADDPHAPATAVAMATEAARLSRVLSGSVGPAAGVGATLPDRTRLPPTLFPPAHNALFDFTRPGGEWIDRRAAAARAVLDQGITPTAMHCDFSCANVRVVGGRVAAIYDVDSVCVIDEPRCVASMAVHYTYTGDYPWTWPSREQARTFVAAYEAARGTPFTAAERARLNAGAIYALAYTSRCEHGHAGAAGMCEVLASAPERYFD
ncbi:MAG: hypothetical protein JO257_03835 [Deltaproteobacteria bacterium]|nr:hypothetical protein [Deltaproteobacteria bacterium]